MGGGRGGGGEEAHTHIWIVQHQSVLEFKILSKLSHLYFHLTALT